MLSVVKAIVDRIDRGSLKKENRTNWTKISIFTMITLFILLGCYSMPSGSKRFLDDYNSRHSLPPAPETVNDPLKDMNTYQHQIMPHKPWKVSEHFKILWIKVGKQFGRSGRGSKS
jgi:hypothetical protein